MTDTFNGKRPNSSLKEKDTFEQAIINNSIPAKTDDWSDVTRETLDNLPEVWTRGILYFLVVFVSIILPWTIFSQIDETGTARGRIDTKLQSDVVV
ncbi:HlyD family secretion protein [Nostoc sp. HK-01]|nr:HlyD family secretion protein [Nostoc sp. HK-01]